MFCPQCKAEYEDGILTCADCGVPLVGQLESPGEEGIEYVQVLETFNVGDVAIIKSILDGGGIDYRFLDENFLSVRPLVQPARLIVARDHAARALELLKDLDLSFKGIRGSEE